MEPLSILHQDAHLVVVDKPARTLVVPAPGRSDVTLVDRLSRQLGQRVFAVHRLDEDTTGAVCIALDEAGRTGMDALFRGHAVDRHYLALVTGRPEPPAGRIESQLDERSNVVRVVPRGGRPAVTIYRSLAVRGRLTLLECELQTGRRNQIRVHLQALGHPLAGDRKYGYRAKEGERFTRPMLHSWRLRFTHPVLGNPVDVEVAAPEPELSV
jgi:23S rRNA pseudouridine1911/1915/1917 synthase